MSTKQKVNSAPSYKPVESEREKKMLLNEINKIRPIADITLEGLSETAKGKILDWQPTRKFFTVEWVTKSESFDKITETTPGLRAYFKIQLFTTQLVFKSSTVRRIDDLHSHFRIPEQFFHQQMRGALRVPLQSGQAGLITRFGELPIVDLSVGGAKIKLPPGSQVVLGDELKPIKVRVGKSICAATDLLGKVVRKDQDVAGVRFFGLGEIHQTTIRQFLIDSLKSFYEELGR